MMKQLSKHSAGILLVYLCILTGFSFAQTAADREQINHLGSKADNWQQISFLYDMTLSEIKELNNLKSLVQVDLDKRQIKVYSPNPSKKKIWELALQTSHNFYLRERQVIELVDKINKEIYLKLAQLDKYKVKRNVSVGDNQAQTAYMDDQINQMELKVIEDRKELTAAKMFLIYIQEYKEEIANRSQIREGKEDPVLLASTAPMLVEKKKTPPYNEPSSSVTSGEETIRIIPVKDYAEEVVNGLTQSKDNLKLRVLVPKPVFLGISYEDKSNFIVNNFDTIQPDLSYNQALLDSLFNFYYRNYTYKKQIELPDVQDKLKMVMSLNADPTKFRYYDMSDESGYRILVISSLSGNQLQERPDSFVYRIIESPFAVEPKAESPVDPKNPFRFKPAQLSEHPFVLESFFTEDAPVAAEVDVVEEKKSKRVKTTAKVVERMDKDSVLVLKDDSIKEVLIVDQKNKVKEDGFVDTVDRQKAAFLLERAKEAIDEQNLSKAQRFVEKSLEIYPTYLNAVMMEGDLYAAQERYDLALRSYEFALTIDPSVSKLYYNRANCFYKLGKIESAKLDYDAAIQYDQKYILAYAGRASIHMGESKFDDAIADFNRIIQLNKYFLPAYKARGLTKLEIGDVSGAIKDFDVFLEYEPDDNQIFYQRALARINLGDYYNGCMDLLQSTRLGNAEAQKAMKKYCD